MTMFWLFFDRRDTRFQPFDGPGISAKPTLVKSVSRVMGTPGRAPVSVPVEALLPSIVTTPFLSNLPSHINMPDDGPVYRATAGVEAAGAEGAAGVVAGGGVCVTGAGGKDRSGWGDACWAGGRVAGWADEGGV